MDKVIIKVASSCERLPRYNSCNYSNPPASNIDSEDFSETFSESTNSESVSSRLRVSKVKITKCHFAAKFPEFPDFDRRDSLIIKFSAGIKEQPEAAGS